MLLWVFIYRVSPVYVSTIIESSRRSRAVFYRRRLVHHATEQRAYERKTGAETEI